jgi:hypothetical protein
VFVVKRRIAAGDVQVAVERAGGFVELAVGPNRGGEAMVRAKGFERHEGGREFHGRGRIELLVLVL